VSVRLRRDFETLITLIEAHALLHQARRNRDLEGAVIATYEDYATVRGLVSDLLADAVERAVPSTIRETVDAIGLLNAATDPLEEGVPMTRVATSLGVDKSTAMRRARVGTGLP